MMKAQQVLFNLRDLMLPCANFNYIWAVHSDVLVVLGNLFIPHFQVFQLLKIQIILAGEAPTSSIFVYVCACVCVCLH